MVDFNSAAVSSPKSAVTVDIAGDVDPSIISSKTKILNICKECGQHKHLYKSKEQASVARKRQAAEDELWGSVIVGGFIFAIITIIIFCVVIMKNDGEGFIEALYAATLSGTVIGGFLGAFLGALYHKVCQAGISFNKKHLTLIGVFAGCFLVFKWYQSSGEKEQLVVSTLNLIDTRNREYTENLNYEFQKGVSQALTSGQIEEEDTLVSLSKDGDPRAEVALGYYQEIKGDYVRAYELYLKAANKGSLRAMFRLGVINLEGLGLDDERPDVADEWFSQSGVNEAESIVSRR